MPTPSRRFILQARLVTTGSAVWCKTGGMRLGQMPLIWVLTAVFSLFSLCPAFAAESDASLVLQSAPDLSHYIGQPITRIQVLTEGGRWTATPPIEHARIGQLLTADLVRRVLAELGDSGGYADMRASVDAEPAGVRLTIRVVPRRLIANIRVAAGGLEQDDVLRVADVRQGGALTAAELSALQGRVMALYVHRGYDRARVTVEALDTDDPASIVLTIDAIPGRPRNISVRRFGVWPDPQAEGMAEALSSYALGPGDRANEDALTDADRALEAELKTRGFHRAKVSHELSGEQSTVLQVKVYAYSKVRFRFEGNRHFDAGQLENVLDVENASDLSPAALTEKISKFYREHGFFDVQVRYSERGRIEGPDPGRRVRRARGRVGPRRGPRVPVLDRRAHARASR
ncbi:MAG: POTRA domain-containing protein [Pseudomonadota bacterium]